VSLAHRQVLCTSLASITVVIKTYPIAADLDELSGRATPAENDELTTDAQADGVQHRRRLAEPEPALSSPSQREQRAILREKMGLPPSYDPRR
jgi:hypothetical protein